jgi:hypothetical protein
MAGTTYQRRGWHLQKQYQITYKTFYIAMQFTLSDILSAELTRRLTAYKAMITAGDIAQSTANHRL